MFKKIVAAIAATGLLFASSTAIAAPPVSMAPMDQEVTADPCILHGLAIAAIVAGGAVVLGAEESQIGLIGRFLKSVFGPKAPPVVAAAPPPPAPAPAKDYSRRCRSKSDDSCFSG